MASFGKDPKQLDQIPAHGGTYVQRAKTAARRLQFGGGGGFHWKDNFRPSEHTPDTWRLIPGEYLQEITHDGKTIVTETFPYISCKEHSTKQGPKLTKTTLCSAGPLFMSIFGAHRGEPYLGKPCHCCPIWAEDVNTRKAKKAAGDDTKGPNRMGTRDMFAFNAWDYGLYFEIQDTDKQGQFRMNPKTKQPYTSWVKGNQNDPQMQGRPWKQGHLLPWYMGKTHKEVLINYGAQVIGKMCKTCGMRDAIVTVVKMCGNPACGQYIYDPNSTTLSDEQRAQIDYYPYTCSFCGVTAYVDEVIECNNPNCSHPERSSIFDVDMVGQRMKSGDGRQTTLQIHNFSEPRPIQIQDAAVLETIKPLDLMKKFGPSSLDLQLKIHNLQGQPAQGTTVAGGAPQQAAPPQQQVGAPPFTAPAAFAAPTAMAGVQVPVHPTAPAPAGSVAQPPEAPAHVQTLQPGPPAQPAPPAMPTAQQVAIPGQPAQQPQLAAPAVQAPPAQPQPQPIAAMPAVPYQVPPGGQTPVTQ